MFNYNFFYPIPTPNSLNLIMWSKNLNKRKLILLETYIWYEIFNCSWFNPPFNLGQNLRVKSTLVTILFFVVCYNFFFFKNGVFRSLPTYQPCTNVFVKILRRYRYLENTLYFMCITRVFFKCLKNLDNICRGSTF